MVDFLIFVAKGKKKRKEKHLVIYVPINPFPLNAESLPWYLLYIWEFSNLSASALGEGNGTPTPVLLPGKSHGQRSLEDCSPWGRWGSDTTERLRFHFSLSCIGEGNGNPLQYSCLENPVDRGAWQATVHGVTKESDIMITQQQWQLYLTC